jgi:Tol biopolymer transport system component
MPRRRTVLALGLLFGLTIAPPVNSAFPGRNGEIAFDNNGKIWVLGADGKNAHLLIRQPTVRKLRFPCRPPIADSSPAWSPNGMKIAFDRAGCALSKDKAGIYVADADGSHQHRLTAGTDPTWSPDGTKLAFVRADFSSHALWSVYVIGADGSGLTKIAERAAQPAWSPDGKTIAYTTYLPVGSIELMNPDGSDRRPLSSAGDTGGASPAWSPDGRRLAFLNDGKIAVSGADGSGLEHLPPATAGGSVAWSPDGTKLVFTAAHYDIWVMTAGGADARSLFARRFKQWRPDWQPLP